MRESEAIGASASAATGRTYEEKPALSRDGEHVERDGEEVDERDGDQKRRDRRDCPRRRSEAELDAATPAVARESCHEQAERHREEDRDEERDAAELERGRAALLDHLGDALAGRQRRPEVTVQHVADVVLVLRHERLVEPEGSLPLGNEARRRSRPECRPDGIARDEVDHEERRREEQYERDEQPRRAAKQVDRPGVSGGPPASSAPERGWCCRHLTSSAAGWSARGPGRRA